MNFERTDGIFSNCEVCVNRFLEELFLFLDMFEKCYIAIRTFGKYYYCDDFGDYIS